LPRWSAQEATPSAPGDPLRIVGQRGEREPAAAGQYIADVALGRRFEGRKWHVRGEPSPLRVSRPMKGPDGGAVLGKELRMPDKHARAIPQLEALEKVLAL
jgi:hypothetical protein